MKREKIICRKKNSGIVGYMLHFSTQHNEHFIFEKSNFIMNLCNRESIFIMCEPQVGTYHNHPKNF